MGSKASRRGTRGAVLQQTPRPPRPSRHTRPTARLIESPALPGPSAHPPRCRPSSRGEVTLPCGLWPAPAPAPLGAALPAGVAPHPLPLPSGSAFHSVDSENTRCHSGAQGGQRRSSGDLASPCRGRLSPSCSTPELLRCLGPWQEPRGRGAAGASSRTEGSTPGLGHTCPSPVGCGRHPCLPLHKGPWCLPSASACARRDEALGPSAGTAPGAVPGGGINTCPAPSLVSPLPRRARAPPAPQGPPGSPTCGPPGPAPPPGRMAGATGLRTAGQRPEQGRQRDECVATPTRWQKGLLVPGKGEERERVCVRLCAHACGYVCVRACVCSPGLWAPPPQPRWPRSHVTSTSVLLMLPEGPRTAIPTEATPQTVGPWRGAT